MPFPRPRPLDAAAAEVATAHAPLTGVLTALASAGLLGAATDNALVACLGVIPGALAAFGTWVGARYVARKGARQVTPLLSPMTTNPDGELVRLMAVGRPVR